VTSVAQSHLALLELDRELEIARDTTVSFQQTLDLFTRRFEGGVGNKLQVARAQAALAETQAQVPDLERRIVLQENAISVLLGRNPGPIARGAPFAERAAPPPPPGFLDPARRRPDAGGRACDRERERRVGVPIARLTHRPHGLYGARARSSRTS
jgi:multidrug efflux system outer membrane protein